MSHREHLAAGLAEYLHGGRRALGGGGKGADFLLKHLHLARCVFHAELFGIDAEAVEDGGGIAAFLVYAAESFLHLVDGGADLVGGEAALLEAFLEEEKILNARSGAGVEQLELAAHGERFLDLFKRVGERRADPLGDLLVNIGFEDTLQAGGNLRGELLHLLLGALKRALELAVVAPNAYVDAEHMKKREVNLGEIKVQFGPSNPILWVLNALGWIAGGLMAAALFWLVVVPAVLGTILHFLR